MKSLKESLFDKDIVTRQDHISLLEFAKKQYDFVGTDHKFLKDYFDEKKVTECWKKIGSPKIGRSTNIEMKLSTIILDNLVVSTKDLQQDSNMIIDQDQCNKVVEFLKDRECVLEDMLDPGYPKLYTQIRIDSNGDKFIMIIIQLEKYNLCNIYLYKK